MEEDAGKNMHGAGGESLVDLNRAGTALIEIVSEPDLRAPAEAREYMKRVREVLMFTAVNDGNLEHGSFRCDANVSVRKRGEVQLGTRVEMKNINSFRFVEEAIDIEIRRQIRLLERGESLVQQTRGYNAEKRESYLLREKEDDEGYRYFPEPDLPPLVADDTLVATLRDALPELADAKRNRYQDELGLSAYAAGVMTSHPAVASLFERATELSGQAVRCANFIQAELMRDLQTEGLRASSPLSAEQLAELVVLVESGRISGKQSKQVYKAIAGSERMPKAVVDELGLEVLSDEATLRALAEELMRKHPDQVAKYRDGKTKLLGFFVGQLMKATKGNADPAAANRLLRELLGGDPEGAP
jgi:aspartyl-tRNA(Asn)/glutamyl-tRNA(Gln) amidotransferase subunit B